MNPRPSSASSCRRAMSPPLPRLFPDTLPALSIISLAKCDEGEGGGALADPAPPNGPPTETDADRTTDR